MDAALHRERLDAKGGKRLHPIEGQIRDLPNGTMIASGQDAYVVKEEVTYLWSWQGYTPSDPPSRNIMLLTPPSTVLALSAGYNPLVRL